MAGLIKTLVATLAVALTLAALAATASASRGLSADPTGFTMTDPAFLISKPGGDVICPVTLQGSLHRTIAKVDGTLMGFVTSGTVNEPACTDTISAATVQTELREAAFPCHIRFERFTGMLPNILTYDSVTACGVTLNVRTIFGTVRCRYIGTLRLTGVLEGGSVRRYNLNGRVSTAQGFPCEPSGTVSGRFNLSSAIRARLI